MTLQRAGNVEFKTVRGVLASSDVEGFSHMVVDDFHTHYLIERGRRALRLEHLVGARIEVKGLIETDLSPDPKIHLIQLVPMNTFQKVI
jgi:hypothetical protein